MGIIVNKDEEKSSRLTDRINADLREKMSETSKIATDPDLAEDSENRQIWLGLDCSNRPRYYFSCRDSNLVSP